MMYQPTLRDVTYQGHPILNSSAVSSEVEEIDKNDIWDNLLSINPQKSYGHNWKRHKM